MKLNITGVKPKTAPAIDPSNNGTYAHIGAKGGTEMMAEMINNSVDPAILNEVNIIHSRVREIDPKRKNVLVLHDTWDDPENEHLKNPKSRARFSKLVFVSNYQQATYNIGLGVPYSDGVVIQNAIKPIDVTDEDKKFDGKYRLIYHTTPHRGLELLIPVYERLYQDRQDIHLDVFSSFDIYGWPARNKPYEFLFDRIKQHPGMTYHGYQPNGVVREYLKRAHIMAYPNIWPETSCIAVMEAMSAKCQVVTSNLSALPETCANFAIMYGYEEDPNTHANKFVNMLNSAIDQLNEPFMPAKLNFQKTYFDGFYNIQYRSAQWNNFLTTLVNEN